MEDEKILFTENNNVTYSAITMNQTITRLQQTARETEAYQCWPPKIHRLFTEQIHEHRKLCKVTVKGALC